MDAWGARAPPCRVLGRNNVQDDVNERKGEGTPPEAPVQSPVGAL
jgi:hypothetical protein